MAGQKKWHYRVDAVRLSGKPDVDGETIGTIKTGLTYKEAKQLQMALYDKYGVGGPTVFHTVREKGG